MLFLLICNFVISQLIVTNSKGDFVLKNWFETLFLKITQIWYDEFN